MDRTEQTLEHLSKALREATWAFEREMLDVNVDDRPTPVIAKLNTAMAAFADVLAPRVISATPQVISATTD
jgi:hypothetical protein